MRDEKRKTDANYVGYEYREVTLPEEYVSLCLDSYPCFGWAPDPNRVMRQNISTTAIDTPAKGNMATLYFRRSRSICNKAELTRLQRNFDGCIAELRALERAKTAQAAAAALAAGILGTAFMAGATFAAVAEPPVIWLTVLLAVPGVAGWIAPYFLYRRLVRRRTVEIAPLIEQKYDEIAAICEKGTHLLI